MILKELIIENKHFTNMGEKTKQHIKDQYVIIKLKNT